MTEDQFLKLVQILTPSSVGGLLVWVVLKPLVPTAIEWIKSKIKKTGDVNSLPKLASIEEEVKLLGTNHIYHLNLAVDEMVATLKRIEESADRHAESQDRKLESIGRDIQYVMGRLNGHSR